MKPVTPAFGKLDRLDVDSAPEELSLVPDLTPLVPNAAPAESVEIGIRFVFSAGVAVAAAVMTIAPVTFGIVTVLPLTAVLLMFVPPIVTVILPSVCPLDAVIVVVYVAPAAADDASLELVQFVSVNVTGYVVDGVTFPLPLAM